MLIILCGPSLFRRRLSLTGQPSSWLTFPHFLLSVDIYILSIKNNIINQYQRLIFPPLALLASSAFQPLLRLLPSPFSPTPLSSSLPPTIHIPLSLSLSVASPSSLSFKPSSYLPLSLSHLLRACRYWNQHRRLRACCLRGRSHGIFELEIGVCWWFIR